MRKALQDFLPRGLAGHHEGEIDDLHGLAFRKAVIALVGEEADLGHLRLVQAQRCQHGAFELRARHDRNEFPVDVHLVFLDDRRAKSAVDQRKDDVAMQLRAFGVRRFHGVAERYVEHGRRR